MIGKRLTPTAISAMTESRQLGTQAGYFQLSRSMAAVLRAPVLRLNIRKHAAGFSWPP